MTNEPNNEQARELSEKELEGIAGGTKANKGLDIVDEKFSVKVGIDDYKIGIDAKFAVLAGSGRCVTVT